MNNEDNNTWLLREDGYLNAEVDLRSIVYHPPLNVIIIVTNIGIVRVIDVNSGVVLQTSDLSAVCQSDVTCRYLRGQDRILFSDGQSIGVRSDYNGVLLLDTILQKPITNQKDLCKLELLLSEAIILKQCLLNVSPSRDYVINELTEKIGEAQKESKKGIKAQKWNTVCLELPLEFLRSATNSSITELIAKNQHTPELGVASAVQERLSDLINEQANVQDRRSMASEAKRRDTFTHWPHMDYKWALPDQMAQAGFYHQPNASGDDRAMCFTCAVCLVCWERTDEPWSEHERHSPNCPFVMGEYTQNVPLSVTYATNPAIDATYRGVTTNVIGTSSVTNLLPTSNNEGLITVYDVSGKLKTTHSFYVTHYDCHILDKFTQDFGVPGIWADNDDVKYPAINKKITALCIVSDVSNQSKSSTTIGNVRNNNGNKTKTCGGNGVTLNNASCKANEIRPSIICGLNIRCRTTTKSRYHRQQDEKQMNDDETTSLDTTKSTLIVDRDEGGEEVVEELMMDVDQVSINAIELKEHSRLYLVVYDFSYDKKKEDDELSTTIKLPNANTNNTASFNSGNHLQIQDENVVQEDDNTDAAKKLWMHPTFSLMSEDDDDFLTNYNVIKQQLSMYQNLIPGESDEIYLPPSDTFCNAKMLKHSGPRLLPVEMQENSHQQQQDGYSLLDNYAFVNGVDNNSTTLNQQQQQEKTISDHITELKNSLKSCKKLNYSRAIQCVSLPDKYKSSNYDIKHLLSTYDCLHLIVVLTLNELNTNNDDTQQYQKNVNDEMKMDEEEMNDDDTKTNDDTKMNEDTKMHEDFMKMNEETICEKSDVESMKIDAEENEPLSSVILVYGLDTTIGVNNVGVAIKLNEEPILTRELYGKRKPLEVNLLPQFDKNNVNLLGQKYDLDTSSNVVVSSSSSSTSSSSICSGVIPEGMLLMVCEDGAVRILELNTLNTVSLARLDDEKFVSAVYCNSLERLCASTAKGSLHFYTLNDSDNYSNEDHDDDEQQQLNYNATMNLTSTTSQSTLTTMPPILYVSSSLTNLNEQNVDQSWMFEDTLNLNRYFQESHAANRINITDLYKFQEMLQFEPYKNGYSAVVPPCWSEMQQAQRQRRLPQHLNMDIEQYTRTWRLQTDTTTWDEHIFELMLPQPIYIGHLDVHYTLHQSATTMPRVEVTLLRQNNTNIGHKRDVKFNVDDSIEFDSLTTENPVTSQEYLRSYNADILAGPIDIANGLDLSDLNGTVTLTSPKLFKLKNRSLLLHVKAVKESTQNNTINNNNNKNKRTTNNGTNTTTSTTTTNTGGTCTGTTTTTNTGGGLLRKTEYMGCDCLHELSLTIYCVKLKMKLFNDRFLRTNMIDSNAFLTALIKTVIGEQYVTVECRSIALDMLNWIGSIRLVRNRCHGHGEAPTYQRDYLKIIEIYVVDLIRKCLLKSSRSVAHKCVKLMIVCSNGSRNLEDSTRSQFDSKLLDALLEVIDDIEHIQSAGGLQWLMLLLYRVTHQDRLEEITGKCLQLLWKIADELSQRVNPYHLILRSHFGLYGTPLEPELFDIEPPPPGKSSSTSVTYASVVTGADNNGTNSSSYGFGNDFHNVYSFNKENLDPKDVLITSPESKIKLRNVTPSRVFRGLLETEPLHFTCISSSDGTRLERADVGINMTGNVINFVPVSQLATNTGGNSQSATNIGTKKIDNEQYYDEFIQSTSKLVKFGSSNNSIGGGGSGGGILGNSGGGSVSNSSGASGNSSAAAAAACVDNVYQMIIHADNLKNEDFAKLITDTLEIAVESEVHAQVLSNEGRTVKRAEEILSPNNSLPWPQLLLSPTQQVIVVERMHSGARRFVTLDFGQPVLLTDVLIPICHELVSISIDIWLKNEDVDGTRLVVTSDIGTRNLVLNDLQPPPLCRYMKITMIGRYGMSTTRCRIPTGYYYGHLIILPEEVPDEQEGVLGTIDVEAQLNTLSILFEDVSCRYSLSCSKLKELLNPFLSSDVSNTAHLAAYMDIVRERSNGQQNPDNVKIFNAYQEAITYQRQLNTVRNVMNRIESSLQCNVTISTQKTNDLLDTGTDKLRLIAECLLEILLTTDYIPIIDEEMCEKLFQGLCVSEKSRIQFLTAILLDRSCRRQLFWGNFLSDTLYEMFSSLYTLKFPQDRVFVLLSFLVRRCTEKSVVFDGTLKVIARCLLPLAEVDNNVPLLAIGVDLPLLGWLLLFLSLQLDMTKNTFTNSTRWDWVTGEMGQKFNKNDGSPRNRKKKIHKLVHSKKKMDDLEFAQKVLQDTTETLSALNSLSTKIEVSLKCKEAIMKNKVKSLLNKIDDQKTTPNNNTNTNNNNEMNEANHSKSTSKRRWIDAKENQNDRSTILQQQVIDANHCRVVCKGLLTLLLNIDHSCSSDLFLLSCKILGRLSRISNLSISDLMSENELIKLIELCIRSELPWTSYALSCLLQDTLEYSSNPLLIQTQTNDLNVGNGGGDVKNDWRFRSVVGDGGGVSVGGGGSVSYNSGVGAGIGSSISSEILSTTTSDLEPLCETFEPDENFITETIIKPKKITSNSNIGQLSSVYESDDSEDLSDFLDDILERGRLVLKKPSKNYHLAYTGSSAIDSRLELGVEIISEITLKRLIMLNTHHLAQTITSNLPNNNNSANVEQPDLEQWPDELINPWTSTQTVIKMNRHMLVNCFDHLLKKLRQQSSNSIERTLQLLLTLSCLSNTSNNERDDKFNPGVIPYVGLSREAIGSLITSISWSSSLSLRCWCSALQILTLACNLPHANPSLTQVNTNVNTSSNNTTTTTTTNWCDNYEPYGLVPFILNHPDFVQFFLRLLSGTGLVFSEKGLAGPSLCKALHDLLVRLQMRCDVVSTSSKPGSLLKTSLLKIVYQLVQPNGPLMARQGPLDAQCKLLQTMIYLDYENADLSIAMSILECTGLLLHNYVSNVERIKCINIGERLSPSSNSFSLFASVLGSDVNKQDRIVSWDILLISLLKLLGKIVQTPLPNGNITSNNNVTMTTNSATSSPMLVTNDNNEDVMDTESTTTITSQTDECKAEQIQQEFMRDSTPTPVIVPCLADTVLQHHPTIIYLCQALAACKASSLSMLANISQQNNSYPDLGEPGSVGDAVFNVLAALVKKASQKNHIMEPLLLFLSETSQLSEPLLWFILQVLDNGDSLKCFVDADGVRILGESLVKSSDAPNTISIAGTTSMVMQHFMGFNVRSDANSAIAGSSSTKKLQQAHLENTMSLVNFAPFSTIRCQSGTAQPADVLIQGGTHRRARTPQWSYHFYPEEAHTELTLTLPNAILLREVHLQPHIGALATCPSAVALEVSADGPSRLVPTCPPLPTSGMTFIRLHLPVPEVVNCIQLRLYKPRDTNHIGLSQIRVLGTSAFGGNIKTQALDLNEDESHCKYSLGWLRLLHHCITLGNEYNLTRSIVSSAANVPNLLRTCCGLLLVPSHIPTLYLPNLEKVLRELTLFNRTNGLTAIKILLQCKPHVSEPINLIQNFSSSSTNAPSNYTRFLMNSPASQTVCELLYQVCRHQDDETPFRVTILLEWLRNVTDRSLRAGNTDSCTPSYISCIAFIVWASKSDEILYDLPSMINVELFNSLYDLIRISSDNLALKYSLDSILCAFCYCKTELFPMLLQRMDVLTPNLATDRLASISDDRKERKKEDVVPEEWYGRLVIRNLSELYLTEEQLETIALVSRSPTAIQQLLDSGLPTLLSKAIMEFCRGNPNDYSMSQLDKCKAILKFFADVCEEKVMRDWLGSFESSIFWSPLLNYLCNDCGRSTNNDDRYVKTTSQLKSESHAQLEEMCVKFLSKCCLCHNNNQLLLSKVLCEVIRKQTNGITGFMRRLILQLLLENEKVPVCVTSEDSLYKNSNCYFFNGNFVPVHPTFNQSNNKALMYLGTNLTLADIFDQYVSFSSNALKEKNNNTSNGVGGSSGNSNGNKKEQTKIDFKSLYSMALADSDLSMAAGVTAKDKRVKDAKNQNVVAPKLKKKRYTISECSTNSIDILEGKIIRCDTLPYKNLSFNLTLAQVLKMMEENGYTQDWPCIHLTITQNKGVEDDNGKYKSSKSISTLTPISCALQVFSSMGGLSLLAQHLPTVYSESIRPTTQDKQINDQSESDWVKVEGNDDIYEDIEETNGTGSASKCNNTIPNVPPHSLTAFGLFLRLPGYADYLLRDMKKALCLLRLVLGVTDDGEGVDIFQTPVADSLPTLPFEVLRKLYDSTPLSTDDGLLLRRLSINLGVVHLLLACLGIFTHQTQINNQRGDNKIKDDRGQLYWAKGTGFGTGSTQQSWNVEQALMKQRSEEEHVTVLLQVLSSYVNPSGGDDDEDATCNVLPPTFLQLLANSSLLPALSSYLRNDSVLDMARHIPLYKAALELLRAIALNNQLVSLLIPEKNKSGPSISSLLKNMKHCVDTYASKLRLNNKPSTKQHKKNSSQDVLQQQQYVDEFDRDEGLAMLMPEIQSTAYLVCEATEQFVDAVEQETVKETTMDTHLFASTEERYLKIMKALQFDTYEMIQENQVNGGYKFVISHHFETIARSAGDTSHPARVKRLAQEAVTLATSLPLSYSSSVFVRCDMDRLDIMKVLITGPSDTPYANGCFEFDVYFPPDYPMTPMLINLETTGHHTVRFNPNLYNDGKVCLSVLNTWHGRPEEKWNAQTSSFLQVLVSIQSLILVPEPYFNEPGYERSRGTPSGTQSSKEYNSNICQATARWGMLEQIVNPCPCFKDVIHAHFYLKRDEICEQVENWIREQQNDIYDRRSQSVTTNTTSITSNTGIPSTSSSNATTTSSTSTSTVTTTTTSGAGKSNKRSTFSNVEALKKVYEQLKEKLHALEPPKELIDHMAAETIVVQQNDEPKPTTQPSSSSTTEDIDMEKMVNEMCD